VGSSFHNGTIEVDVAGNPRVGVAPAAGGIAIQANCDAAQDVSMPEYFWSRLIEETPDRYEPHEELCGQGIDEVQL
jgi:hypothetical protein